MNSMLQLDPRSLANLAKRVGAEAVELADGRIAFTLAGKRIEVSALTLSGRVTIDSTAIELREVRPRADGVTIGFEVVT